MITPIYSPAPGRYENGMKYRRRCGKSGILLPEISLGLWHNFGDVNTFANSLSMAHYAYDKYLEDIKAQVGAGKSIALYHKVTTKKRNAERYSDRIELQGFQSCFRLFVKPSQSPLKPNQDAATLLVRNHARNGDKRTRITKQGVKD